jgi:hypothetical protein
MHSNSCCTCYTATTTATITQVTCSYSKSTSRRYAQQQQQLNHATQHYQHSAYPVGMHTGMQHGGGPLLPLQPVVPLGTELVDVPGSVRGFNHQSQQSGEFSQQQQQQYPMQLLQGAVTMPLLPVNSVTASPSHAAGGGMFKLTPG